MKLICQIKLLTTKEQSLALKDTLHIANSACNEIAEYAWNNKVFGKFNLHKKLYYSIKENYNLSAQIVVRCFSKVSNAYELDKKTKRVFKPFGSIAYDDRILSFNLHNSTVSIWSVEGRLKNISFVCGEKQKEIIKSRQGESDLVYKDGQFYLFVTCNVGEMPEIETNEFLGVDFGIVNIATDSQGEKYTGNHLNNLRKRYKRIRRKLQKKNTKSAKRLLRKRRRKERRMAQNVNHIISKEIVEKAKRHSIGIALEDLKGIEIELRLRKVRGVNIILGVFPI